MHDQQTTATSRIEIMQSHLELPAKNLTQAVFMLSAHDQQSVQCNAPNGGITATSQHETESREN